MKSIRTRLMVGLLAALVLSWGAVAAVVYGEAHHEIEEVFDAHLAQYARVLQALVSTAGDGAERLPFLPDARLEIGRVPGMPGHSYERKLMYQVWDRDGRLLLRSTNAPITREAPMREGYSEAELAGHAWRLFDLADPAIGLRVRVGERDDVRGELVSEIVLQQLLPVLLLLPFIGGVLWTIVDRGLRPLNRVAEAVSQRSPEQLTPVELQDAPKEIHPLIRALNRLFQRVASSFERERRFTADAAHELRTPLAGIRTQAQIALGATDAAARQNALERILQGVDRAARLEQQLLTLARLDPQAQQGLIRQCLNLENVASEVIAELVPEALVKRIDLSLESDETPVVTWGDPALLSVLLRNLIENAVRYTPSGGEVIVRLSGSREETRLSVCDSGPGIAQDERERVLERFYRGLGHEASGSGLGLSIVTRIAELHGAGFELETAPEGGLAAVISFRSASPDAPAPSSATTAPRATAVR